MTALNMRQAAAYVGLSLNTFKKALRARKIPPPADLGVRRRLWHPAALDAALLGRPLSGGVDNDREQRKAAWRQRREGR